MPLYIPLLRADAVPPVNFPPIWRGSNLLVIGTALAFFPGALTVLKQQLGGNHAAFLQHGVLAALFLFGYFYISSCILQRPTWYLSRYQHAWELLKLLGSTPLIWWLGGARWVAGGLPLAVVFTAAYMFMLHFIYADNSAFLQKWGCKWSDPSRWRGCTGGELVFTALILALAGALCAWNMHAITIEQRWDWVLMQCAAIIAIVSAAYWASRSSHSLHLHHYVCVFILLPFTSCVALSSAVLQGMSLAIYVDGIACWGMDPILVPTTLDIMNTDVATVFWVTFISELDNVALVARRLLIFAHLQDSLKLLRRDDGLARLSDDFAVLLQATEFLLGSEVVVRLAEQVDGAALHERIKNQVMNLAGRFGATATMFAALNSWYLMFYAGSVELNQAITLKSTSRQPTSMFSDLKQTNLFGIASTFLNRQAFWHQHEQLRDLRSQWTARLIAQSRGDALRDATMEMYNLFQNG